MAAVRAAEAAVETARLNLEWTRVRSPIAGRVSRAEVTEGNLVQAGPPDATLLTTVVSLDSMYLYFDSDEQTYLRYSGRAATAARHAAGGRAAARSTSGSPTRPAFPHEGRLDFVDNRVDPGQRHHPDPRDLLQPRPRGSRPASSPGSSWSAARRSPTLLVRDAAVGTDQDRKFVLVLGKGDTPGVPAGRARPR